MNGFFTRLLSCAVALVAPVALAACGSSSKQNDDLSNGLPGPAVKVMTIYPKAGLVSLPEIPDGATAAVKAINQKGGVNGHPLELIVCSDGNNANTAADCGRKAVKDGVVALVGSASTFSTTIAPITSPKQIPSVGNIAASTADFVSQSVYPVAGGPTTTFAALPRFVADQGAKKIVVVRPDLAAAATAVQKADAALQPLGQKIVGQVPVPIGAPDMSSYVAQVTSQGADGVVVILPGTQAISFVEALRQAAPNVKIGLSSTQPGPVYDALKAKSAGIVQALDTLPVPGTDTAQAVAYEKDMKAAGFDDISGYRINSWLSVEIVADLAKGMKDVTGPALTAKLNRTVNLQTGLTPPLQWVRGNVGGTPRSFTGCALASELTSDGKQKLVTGKFFDVYANRPCRTP